ncbi:MAG: type II secretion system protein M [Gammaproteobacteria bacterium]|nr:type II secretion system protein M [Gammaproteobacteria bacterium]MDH5801890.1 type II secretion system protein M [Gammaproteobacteria bacterium]
MDQYIEQITQWFNSKEQRERQILVGGVVSVVLLLLYAMVWDPIVGGKAKLEQQAEQMRRDLTWMQEQASKVRVLKAGSAPLGRIQPGQSLLGIIDRSAKSSQLGNSVKRVKPDGENKARVWLENANFNDVIRWAESLKRSYNVEIESVSIEKEEQAGLISARFVFQAATQ